MLKEYRKRFVLSNMLMVGAVLLLTFIALDIFMFRNDYRELRNTMAQVLSPWQNLSISHEKPSVPLPQFETPELRPEDREEMRSRPLQPAGEAAGPLNDNYDIVVLHYDQSSDGIYLLNRSEEEYESDSSALAAAVSEIRQAKRNYGILSRYGLVYYKEDIGFNCRMALTDISYLGAKLLRNTLLLLLAFLVLMGLFLLISRRLASRAARPMEEAIEMERQFVADISHDLKTPITVILANSSIVKSNPEASVGEQSQWIDSTEAAAKSMMNTVNEMLTLSSLESAGRAAIVKEPVNLSSIAEKAVLQMESLAYDRGLSLESDIAEHINVMGSNEYLPRICDGLLENALKYEPAGGKVEISLRRDKKNALLCVKNHGSLIAEEDLPHIFERFYRGDKARGTQQGHGLGLPIIRQVAELIGAEISVSSDKERGTVFSVTFELAE